MTEEKELTEDQLKFVIRKKELVLQKGYLDLESLQMDILLAEDEIKQLKELLPKEGEKKSEKAPSQ